MSADCTALILAAGEGRRMGAPKALLMRAGVPLVQLHVERALELGCANALLIVRPALAEHMRALFASVHYVARMQVVVGETSSQASSLALLVRHVASQRRSLSDLTFLIAPVDTLPCRVETYRALSAALRDGARAATPRVGAHGGHPVLLCATLLAEYLEGAVERCRPLRALLADDAARRARVQVADPDVLANIDTRDAAVAQGLSVPI